MTARLFDAGSYLRAVRFATWKAAGVAFAGELTIAFDRRYASFLDLLYFPLNPLLGGLYLPRMGNDASEPTRLDLFGRFGSLDFTGIGLSSTPNGAYLAALPLGHIDVRGYYIPDAINPVPEPGTWALLLSGLLLVYAVRQRKRNGSLRIV